MASKDTFNASVRHVKATVGLAERISSGENLADALNGMIEEKSINEDEVLPFVSMLLIDKFKYFAASKNMDCTISELAHIQETVKSWNAFDIVILYNHPDLGVLTINPKNPAHVSMIDRINKSELLVAYLGCFGKAYDAALAEKAADTILNLYSGSKAKDIPALLKGPCSYKAPFGEKATKSKKAPNAGNAPKAVRAKATGKTKPGKAVAVPESVAPAAVAAMAPKPAAGPKPGSRMTPMYGVLVTNELFHNGNVEAWKRIIDSFTTKHPDLNVLVYYDGERIVNLNALFKWGKVKHGSVIQFAVSGQNICDVAKLQRYLAQGASIMFEAFLRGPVNGVLSLF
ncbi:MAG: hypothetical protein CVV47_00870 [Spirochaetae bacterium HGW-Spirochaetae-3]|nr:MAG: hypothetical protein CVV47_00870 [Spirochaetae bacterium HGW-Spirochaetae-3]